MEHLDSNFIRTHVQHRHINKSPKPCRIKTFKIGGRPPWKLWWKHPVKPHSLSYCTTMFCFPVYDLPLIRLFKALSIHRNYSHFLPGMIAFDGLICCFGNVSFFFFILFWCFSGNHTLHTRHQSCSSRSSAVGSSIAFLNTRHTAAPTRRAISG